MGRLSRHLSLRRQYHDVGRRDRDPDDNDLIKLLERKAKAGTITLIYATRDEEHNSALVLKRFLQKA